MRNIMYRERPVQPAMAQANNNTVNNITNNDSISINNTNNIVSNKSSNKSSNSNRRQFTISTAYEQTQRCRVAKILQTLKIHEAVIEAARSVQNSSILTNTANPHLHLHHTTHHYLTSNTHAHKHKHVCSVTHQGDHLSLFIAGNDAAELEANSEDLRKERG